MELGIEIEIEIEIQIEIEKNEVCLGCLGWPLALDLSFETGLGFKGLG